MGDAGCDFPQPRRAPFAPGSPHSFRRAGLGTGAALLALLALLSCLPATAGASGRAYGAGAGRGAAAARHARPTALAGTTTPTAPRPPLPAAPAHRRAPHPGPLPPPRPGPTPAAAALPYRPRPAPPSALAAALLAALGVPLGVLLARLRPPPPPPPDLFEDEAQPPARPGPPLFDPLGLAGSPAAVAHGRAVLAMAIASLAVFAAPDPGTAAGLDFGFNYDFPVMFQGFIVDHRILVDVLVTGQFIGFVGALIGGSAARQRKEEISKLARKLQLVNRQLRNMNRQMRRQRIATLTQAAAGGPAEAKPMDAITQQLLEGLRLLRDKQAAKALDAFQRALVMNRAGMGDLDALARADAEVEAYRGIAMAYQALGQPERALEVMEEVQQICAREGDKAGIGDAYGVMADLYTEMGRLDKAAEYYDRYLVILASEDWLWRLMEDTSWM